MYIQVGKYAVGVYRSKTTRLTVFVGSKSIVEECLLLMRETDCLIAAYNATDVRKVAKFAPQHQPSVGP